MRKFIVGALVLAISFFLLDLFIAYNAGIMAQGEKASFVFDRKYTLMVYVSVTAYFMIGTFKMSESVDKYLARSVVYISVAIITAIVSIFCHGWLLDFIAGMLRMIGVMFALYASTCVNRAIIVAITNYFEK